jgi:hypothetical protein
MDFFPEGPREWSPRMKVALGAVEKIRSLIPPELLVDRSSMYEVGQTYHVNTSFGKLAKVMLIMKAGEYTNQVWLYSGGHLYVGIEVVMLLRGELKGFEQLVGRWPWPGDYGPPTNYKDSLGRYT